MNDVRCPHLGVNELISYVLHVYLQTNIEKKQVKSLFFIQIFNLLKILEEIMPYLPLFLSI